MHFVGRSNEGKNYEYTGGSGVNVDAVTRKISVDFDPVTMMLEDGHLRPRIKYDTDQF